MPAQRPFECLVLALACSDRDQNERRPQCIPFPTLRLQNRNVWYGGGSSKTANCSRPKHLEEYGPVVIGEFCKSRGD